MTTMTEDDRQYDNRVARLRRLAHRQGLRLIKSRRRTFRALDFGVFWVVDDNNCIVGPSFPWSGDGTYDLDILETYLREEPDA